MVDGGLPDNANATPAGSQTCRPHGRLSTGECLVVVARAHRPAEVDIFSNLWSYHDVTNPSNCHWAEASAIHGGSIEKNCLTPVAEPDA